MQQAGWGWAGAQGEGGGGLASPMPVPGQRPSPPPPTPFHSLRPPGSPPHPAQVGPQNSHRPVLISRRAFYPRCRQREGHAAGVPNPGQPSGATVSPRSKESAFHAGDQGLNPGSGGSPGEGHGDPLQYSCLQNPMGRGAWRALVDGVTKSRTRWPPTPEAQPVSGSARRAPRGSVPPGLGGIRRHVRVCVFFEAPCASARLCRAASVCVCGWEGAAVDAPLVEPLCDSARVCVTMCPEPV